VQNIFITIDEYLLSLAGSRATGHVNMAPSLIYTLN